MRLHVLGICGTFMSGLAVLAKQQGHDVVGADLNVYPPMSTQLMEQGIPIIQGYEADQFVKKPDLVIIGNVIRRGNPALEHILSQNIPYMSGPEWLAQAVLQQRWVLAVSGTHGKTTTTSMLAWILECAGLNPGFLIGGIPENFGYSSRLGQLPYFVIEADEYDTAFFDKRSKFIHYHPKTLIINNLEYDHADIFPNLAAIKQQFHYLIRTIPPQGLIITPSEDKQVSEVLNQGCWTPVTDFGRQGEGWHAQLNQADGSIFTVFHQQNKVGEVHWNLLGQHNVNNALAAIAAANHIQISPMQAITALSSFNNVKRRLEIKGKIKNIVIYDDFAHHPTAIATTLNGLRARIGDKSRMIAVLEFGSYTMRSGVHKDKMQLALKEADMVVCKNTDADWGLKSMLREFSQPTFVYDDVDQLVSGLVTQLQAGDHVVVMSNSGFGGIHDKMMRSLSSEL